MSTPSPSPSRVRPPVAAGRFYPRDAEAILTLLHPLLANAPLSAGAAPKAVIAPHAGYVYSGPIAASAYAQLARDRDTIKRVVLLGPSHFARFDGLAASSATAFATPLGEVPVDLEVVRRLQALPHVTILDEAHASEHALEVQLPFLQLTLSAFEIIPLVSGEASAEQISQVLDLLWGGPETRFVISSDLSHYLDAETARRVDAATAQAVEKLQPEGVGEDQACGRLPICGLLQVARRHGLHARTLDLRNSGDTAGPRHQVVGYGAFAFGAG